MRPLPRFLQYIDNRQALHLEFPALFKLTYQVFSCTVYVLDLCQSLKAKAICGVLLSLVGNFGTLVTYTLGIFLNWRELAAILLTFAVPYVIGKTMILIFLSHFSA